MARNEMAKFKFSDPCLKAISEEGMKWLRRDNVSLSCHSKFSFFDPINWGFKEGL